MALDLTLPIPVLSNSSIIELMDQKLINISYFKPDRLSATAYQLSPYIMRFRNDDKDGLGPEETPVSLGNEVGHTLRPGEYAIVSPREKIELCDGLVADFYPSSWCIDKRLILTAGRLDARYVGQLVFGLFNGGVVDVKVNAQTQIARATFGWLGRQNTPDYDKATLPGAYNRELQELRLHEDALEKAEEALRKQKDEIAKRRREIAAAL